jgi:putative acyl-CoA dehydrogenase
MCLDVLRAVIREPDALPALMQELRTTRGAHASLDAASGEIEAALGRPDEAERSARRIVETMATALQASLLVRHAPGAVADAFVAGRLAERGLTFGALPSGIDPEAVLQRTS